MIREMPLNPPENEFAFPLAGVLWVLKGRERHVQRLWRVPIECCSNRQKRGQLLYMGFSFTVPSTFW